MENQSSIKEIINNAMKDVRSILDTDTVVGEQIHLDNGITIIPISKISMGFASGGLDVPAGNNKNFGGGGGTGVTVLPVGFLTVYPEGKVEIIPVAPAEMGPVEQIADIINRAPEIINRIKSAITGETKVKKIEVTEEAPKAEPEVAEMTFDTPDNKKKADK